MTAPGSTTSDSATVDTGPRLVAHDGVIAQHFRDHRSLLQPGQFLGRPRLEHPAILDDGRARREPAFLRTNRRAAAQQARGDREDGEPPLPASGVGRH